MVKKTLQLDSDSSSSSEDESLPPPSTHPTTAMKSTVDSGSESDDDFDRPLNSIAPKQGDDGSKLKKPRSKPNSKPTPSPSPKRAPIKRPAASALEKDSKKSKVVKASGGGEEEGKKSVLFQRLWSEDDEIAVLKGMLDYKKQKGSDPMEDVVDFHKFVKDSLHINVDRKQVTGKVRRLKKRFKNSQTRKTFNPHETILIDLCNKIWGQKVESNTDTTNKAPKKAATSKSARNAKMEVPTAVENGSCATEIVREAGKSSEGGNSVKFLGKASVSMGLDEAIVEMGLGLCSEDRKSELEEEWRKLHVEESSLFVKKLDLARQESEMISAALRSGGGNSQ